MNEKKTRILYVENGIGYGGAIICLRHLVRNLDKTKYEPLVVTSRTGQEYEGIANESAWQHIPDRRIDVVSMRERLFKTRWISYVPGLRFVLNQMLSRIDDIVNYYPFYRGLLKCAKNFEPDIIHLNNEPLCNRAGIFVGKKLGIPIVQHVRGPQKGSRMMHWVYKKPDYFVSVSHWVAHEIEKLDVSSDKISVIYDGLELDKLNMNADGKVFRNAYDISDDEFAVGLVGLLIPWKGQRIFLDAAKQLKSTIPGLKMLIVGGTPDECHDYEKELKERVNKENLSDTVIFTGHASDMPHVYNGLDIVVSASVTPEPLGTVVIESMTLARPLVAPAHGGAAEMADHEINALLFEAGSAQALANAILQFYNNPNLRLQYGAAAREKALQTFSVDLHVQRVTKVYEQILNN